jgi:hypothetical protein
MLIFDTDADNRNKVPLLRQTISDEDGYITVGIFSYQQNNNLLLSFTQGNLICLHKSTVFLCYCNLNRIIQQDSVVCRERKITTLLITWH